MTIKYQPNELLRKIAPIKKIERLVTGKLTLNRAVLSFLDDADFIDQDAVEETALRTIKQYKEKYKDERDDGASVAEAKDEALNDKVLLINRVQNTILSEVSSGIKDAYDGEYYRWTPSDAEVPDPIHQLNYGKKFKIGVGEMPGDRYGCRCGMEILVAESKLEL